MNDQRHEDDPYGDNLYLLASTLDPRFGLHWVDLLAKERGEEVKEYLKGLFSLIEQRKLLKKF